MNMFEEFKTFLLRGNVVDLAVGVVIGVAFAAVVDSLVADLITPVLGAIGGEPDFSQLTFSINDSRFFYGNFINNVLSFVLIAAAVFFLVVVPVNKLMERMKTERPADATTRDCPQCLSSIPVAARRCAFCTSEVGAG
jgi:large conductance mechanosensitive channel